MTPAESDPSQETSLTAAEYVLGTLDAAEAERFEAALEESAAARRELVYWEARLGALGLGLAPVAPPASVWERIAARVADSREGNDSDEARRPADAAPAPRSAARRLGFWRGLAVAASIAALVLAGLLFVDVGGRRPAAPSSAPAYASVIYDKPTGTGWLITAKPGTHRMSILAMGNYHVPNGKILRAWLKPAHGNPIALGRLPHTSGEHDIKVSDKVERSMPHATAIMVSLEDSSHAGNPSPSGKVLWKVPVARRTG